MRRRPSVLLPTLLSTSTSRTSTRSSESGTPLFSPSRTRNARSEATFPFKVLNLSFADPARLFLTSSSVSVNLLTATRTVTAGMSPLFFPPVPLLTFSLGEKVHSHWISIKGAHRQGWFEPRGC